MKRSLVFGLWSLVFICIFSSCVSAQAQAAKKSQIEIKDKKLSVEIADTDQLRVKGLMFRTQLKENEGMLFVYEKEQYLNFWMRDTYIPLDVAFISKDKKIVQIEHMIPFDITAHISNSPVMYALEVRQGWFHKNNIKIGDKFSFAEESRVE